jgi:hypothetical protein
MRIHSLPSLLLVLLAGLLRVHVASADLLTLLVNATNAPAGALDKAAADASIYMAKMTTQEGSSYSTVSAGQAVPNSVRMLRADGGGDHDNERKLIDCPNQCSNSGSNTCRLLGCAYCGVCRRFLQQAAAFSSTTTLNKHRKIESDLTAELTAAYCENKPGCTLKAIIKRVNADGTMTLAV